MEPRNTFSAAALEQIVKMALSQVGVTLNGPNDFDPQVHDKRAWQQVIDDGMIGLGEAYMDGRWTCKDLATLVYKISITGLEQKLLEIEKMLPPRVKSRKSSHTVRGEKESIQTHYDIGLELYAPMLGPTMQYSCSKDFERYGDLGDAQTAKMDHLGRKLGLLSRSRIVDVGCGYGTLARFLNERYGYIVRGMTLSDVQLAYAREHCIGSGNEFFEQNYQETPNRLFPRKRFDGLVSVGMVEHVGKENISSYFKTCESLLKNDGVAVIHGITGAHGGTDPWMDKYIFPGGYIPAESELVNAANDAGFVIRDIENIGLNYDPTLLAWRENVMAVKNYLIATGKYDEGFFRRWDYYLSTCAGKFRSEDLHVWQMVLTKKGSRRKYRRAA